MKVYREAQFKDGLELLKNLRADDKAEVEGMGQPTFGIPFSILFSEHATSFFDYKGNLAGCAGVVRLDEDQGSIWMLCTDNVLNMRIAFFRQAKQWMKIVENDYKLLWNVADAKNELHHQLLRFLGFKAIRCVELGPNNRPYYEIVKLCAYQPQS